MPSLDAKTIATIATAIGLLVSHFYGQSTQAITRQEVGVGAIAYTDAMLAERDKELADLRDRVRFLETKR